MINIDSLDLEILKFIDSFGASSYIVGGAVRDYFLENNPNDYDILIVLNNNKIEDIFKDYKLKSFTPNHYGVVFNSSYYDVEVCENVLENLFSRDFTINSIAYSKATGFIDPTNGISDCKNKILRVYNNDFSKISTNSARILRGIRLEFEKKLTIEENLYNYLISNNQLVLATKNSKIVQELNKILLIDKPSLAISKYKEIFFNLISGLRESYGFLQHNPYHSYDVFIHTMIVLDSTKSDLALRLAALYHDLGKTKTFTMDDKGIGHFYNHYTVSYEIILADLAKYEYPKKIIKLASKLVLYHDYQFNGKNDNMINFLKKFGVNNLDLYFSLKSADIKGQNPKLSGRLADIDNYYKLALKLKDEMM